MYGLLPPALRVIGGEPTGREHVASSALARMAGDPTYTPTNLAEALSVPHDVMEV
jgi:hypothetical protein